MDISACSAQLLSIQNSLGDIPREILDILRGSSNTQYLDTLSQLALNPEYSTTIFTTHEPVFVEICSRWLAASDANDLSALAALARVLPYAPYLTVYAKALLDRRRHGALGALASQRVTALQDLPLEELHSLLLSLYRLLAFDNAAFASLVSPAHLQLLLTNAHHHIRYLAIRTLCLYLHTSDVALTSMTETYIGEGEIAGQWEDKTIDYFFFSLWENERLKDMGRKLHETKSVLDPPSHNSITIKRVLRLEDLSRTTACIAGVLLPRLDEKDSSTSSLVMTETMTHNMRSLAEGVKGSMPLLVSGFSGSGKTLLIRDIASELGQSFSMIRLHLNEQTDAKLLIGMYTSDKTPGSFSWRPGVLTKAVTEGRWLIIEDLDRAPTEIISILLPLLERRELLIPNWGETIQAAPGFKIVATVRSAVNSRGEDFNPTTNMIGTRHWQQIQFRTPSEHELAEIVVNRYPILHTHTPKFMEVYRNSRGLEQSGSHSSVKTSIGRPLGPQNLLRWCRRVQDLLLTAGIDSGDEPISEAIIDHIFLEAIHSFLGTLPPGTSQLPGVDVIAQSLHMSAERVQYCLNARKPDYHSTDSTLRIGRVALSKQKRARDTRSAQAASPFALTNHVLWLLESIAVTVKQAEPCLLVGETGTGKTTVVQQLANALNQKLTVVNLSQQSEAGDLLGGYKPVNMRALAIPMKEQFDELIEMTFPSKRNQHYLDALGKAIAKSRWKPALTVWQKALRTVETYFEPSSNSKNTTVGPHSRKRKLQSPKLQKLQNRWDKFASQVQTFQMHLDSGPKGFAFFFVEGNIVKAARNGEWVLLDEINLASPDTLESLADLFSDIVSGGPSILLTETGDTERIYAHKSFRIFGAMNPATDVGKQDLPVSLRSKFTELFIEAPDKDLENLVSVVKAYLGSCDDTDVRAPTDVAHLYLEIKQLADGNRLVDGANQKPHFSLRTLTRTLVYALDIRPIYGLRRALFEGFSMSFLTVLNKESELLVQPRIDKHILGAQKNVRATLHQTPRLPKDGKNYVQFKHYWIAQGAGTIEEQPHYIITPFIERNLLNLVRATSTRRFPVLLQGPTSSGKTSMIEYLAKISGNKFVRINNHEHTDLQEYLGTYVSGPDGRLQYQDGVLVHALREGYWVVLDELNLAPTDVLEALNRLLDDNRELLIPETQQVVRPHPNFMLFAAQNPPGVYGGRKVLSRAFRNRFLELHFDDIPEDELETILRERSQIAPSFCTRIVAVYKQLSILRQSERLFEQKNSFATLRDLFRWALRDADDREQLAVNGFLLLAERVRNQGERLAVKQVIEAVMKVKIDIDQLYGMDRLQKSLGSLISAATGIVWTKSMRRLAALVTEAVKSNEPVLLVGETGSGKTTVCQAIAKLLNVKLHIVNAHQNIETGDLIGSQRPIRNRAHAEFQLAQEVISVLIDYDLYKEDYEADIVLLLEAYEALQRQSPGKVSDEVRLRIEQSKIRANALFEWADGSLVHAMRDGQHFLLDEISLADDSVLERLNSVLEPGRTLFLAEKGTNDALVIASPEFQFLATMNPGGDYGKRELSPALRNRFTEIWVPHASEEDEMLEIAQAKLTPSFIDFAQPMVNFAAWYAVAYNPAAPHISIRDLLAWIHFVNTFQATSSDLALLHGAAMVYIDGLGANPASKMSIAETEFSKERGVCLLKLDEVLGRDISSKYNENCELSLTGGMFGIGPFTLAQKSNMAPHMRYSLRAPTTAANAMKIVRALQIQKPILLEGSPGVGKTTLVAALSQAVGMSLTRINLSDQTDLMDLFGSDVPIEGAEAGNFGWCDAPFLRAMQKGEWVLLDEMNLASQSVLEGLNACLDHRGEVYVSELDQTFQRHPDFVVFAAQNPHHQGGGRKGLPASFVNRFTVVYTDIFTAEDLLIISNEMYPDLPHNTTETILQCVSALSQRLQQDHRIGAHGSPWEINLRDVLRWLHLLTSQDGLLSSARPEDFLNLLFLQRFRTTEDVAAVSQELKQHLPENNSHSYFHGTSDGSIEIGLGVLPRNKYSRPSSSGPLNTKQANPPILESVMLCVQNKWPCLLVGSSGSGKTTLIHKLASSVGACVVDLSLNSETDTMDLVGGYEQLDPKRQFAGLIKRLLEYTRRAIIKQIGSGPGLNNNLAKLEAKLQAPVAAISDISQLILAIATENSSPEYLGFSNECQSLMQLSAVDNRARFEWVDGILVKALKQGKWLVLDNANLCNPSVLDRLNSLLEPNGFVSINEHRNPDGSAQVVKPHPNFRLFMTMDPRHGELSRAMRNRSVELFMLMHSPSPKVDVLGSSSESTLSRFGLLRAFDWDSTTDSHFDHILALYFDHLNFQDLEICHRWQMQTMIGLNNFPPETQASVTSFANLYQQMLAFDGKTFSGIKATYENIGKDLGLSQDFGKMQTIHPFNNHILLSMTAENQNSSNLRWLGDCFELLLEIYRFGQALALAAEQAESKLPAQMSRLERSLASANARSFESDSTQPLASFMQDMALFLRRIVDGNDFGDVNVSQEFLPFATEILSYLRDIFDLAQSSDFDEGVFQSYQAIGRSMCNRTSTNEASESLVAKLGSTLGSKLDTFNSSWQLHSGLEMEKLWTMFKPTTAKDLSQLEFSLQVKGLATRFDALKWSSGASIQELDILRNSIARIHDAVDTASLESFGLLEDVSKSLEELESRSDLHQTGNAPYFRPQFEMLCQYQANATDRDSSDLLSVVGLLGGRPNAHLMGFGSSSSGWNTLSQLQRMAATSQHSTELAVVRNILPVSILHKLGKIGEISLQSLGLLRTEMDVMAKTIASVTQTLTGNHFSALDKVFKKLNWEFKGALGLDIRSEEFESIKALLSKLPFQLGGRIWDQSEVVGTGEYVYQCIASVVEPRFDKSGRTSSRDDEELSLRFVQFFTGCLLLYVPDRPFDPALRPMVERNRHQKRKLEMETKLKALQNVELVFTGQNSSFRIELAKQDLLALGAEPEVPSIVRPHVSELGQLQAEFNNILNTIALRSPVLLTLHFAFQGQAPPTQEIKVLRSNIAQAINRLSTSFHAYEDITKPLIVMLQGLDVGLALALLAGTQPTPSDQAIKYLCNSTPFLGAGPYNLMRTNAEPETQRTASFDPRFHYMETVAVAQSVSKDLNASSAQIMFQAFHSSYQEWKDQLDRDQRENAVNSSLYRYRGGEEDSNEADEQDFLQLFPNYISTEEERTKSVKTIYDARAQAQRLAGLQRQILHSTESPSQGILSMLRNASRTIADMWQDDRSLSKSPVPTENILSAVITSLDESNERLHGQATPGKLYNFYTDANLSEAQKLITLIHKIQTRFVTLQEAWPEHATLGDVLRTSSELMVLRHTEPIAKLLTKAEQLHGYVHEWQVVASKEYAAISLYDQLTDVLVSWRRLELSTWARLLDMEDKKCNDDADSWWFIAYEVIIAAPLSMVDAQDDLRSHAEGMFRTLADFLATTSMGQYSHRLGMIGCFKRYLEILVKEVPAMIVIHNTLANFLSYYTRFEGPIKESLRKGRQALEKAMKEILLFASWKDTNINALRDSAKRSHHKLFKVVRKYRAQLARPSETILGQGLPESTHLSETSASPARPVEATMMDAHALRLWQQHITVWQTKPERFVNASSTTARMLQMSELPPTAIEASSYLESFGVELIDSIKILQRETPSKATKENAEGIKHLKAGKRKLYAETLRGLRQMGFRSNMSNDAIAKQASNSVILTNSPALTTTSFSSDVHAAEYHFHKLLNIMPQVKARSRNHSEDLTHGEVSRSVGYLESMVSVILRQRVAIANASTDLGHLDKTMKRMQGIWAPGSYTLTKRDHAIHNAKGIQQVLRWLPGILEAGSIIIEKHARLGGHDASTVTEDLMNWKGRIIANIRAFDDLPELPAGLSSSRHEQVFAEAECTMRDLKAHLQVVIKQNPGLTFVFKQIDLWTKAETASPGTVTPDDSNAQAPRPSKRRKTGSRDVNGEQSLTLKGFDNSVSSISDSILVAIQRMQEACASIPTTKDDATWLVRTDECLTGSLRSLGSREVNALLENALSKIQLLSASDDALRVAAVVCAMAFPIVEQYRNIQEAAVARYIKLYQSLCKLASLLAHSFSQIAQDGFCSPPEKSAADDGKSEKLEGGTGLGEGEGAEDISKDVEDDEDLSEFAQQGKKEKDGDEIEDQEDAVNMDQDELEGEMGDVSDKGEDDESASEGEEDDIDEETGDVDNLDPSAVDEKLWDGKADEAEKEKEGSKSKGKAEKDEQAAAESAAQQENDQNEDIDIDDEASQAGADEGEEVSKEETEKMDPHAQDRQNLDLPDEMDLDNVDSTDAESASGDSDMDSKSDIDQEQDREEIEARGLEDVQNDESDMAKSPQSQPGDAEEDEGEAEDANEARSPVDTEPEEEDQQDDQSLLPDHSDNAAVDQDNIAPRDVRGLGEDTDPQNEEEQASASQAQANKGIKGSSSSQENAEAAAKDGQIGSSLDRPEQGQAKDDTPNDNSGSQAFQKLGDALEKWHRRQRQIQNASEQQPEAQPRPSDVEMAGQDFEHLHDEEADADTQALGAANDEQARALDENAMDSEMHDQPCSFPAEEPNEEGADQQEENMENTDDKVDRSDVQSQQSRPGAFIANNFDRSRRQDQAQSSGAQNEEDIEELDNDLSTTHLQSTSYLSPRSAEEARRLWSHYDSLTRDLSLSLTEQLRLILAPTLATKMRGDFRTGKRLNIKRIIPYIASQYKRDKIWMRRTTPSKRNYQIMLAVDDSKSMGESESGQLAFETLALVSKSLSMLEVGEICVVGFGNEVHVAHDFDKPFSSEAGAQIFQHFTFQQTKTNVRKLVADSITLFREARRKTFNAGTDLWQLELIISDGICEDHDAIRRLVRQAQEERIMIVFVIVDALLKGESIMDMSQAVFEPDATGETKLKIKRYLDDFPFPYYLVVGNVRELPGVLAQALRQWFAEVVDSG